VGEMLIRHYRSLTVDYKSTGNEISILRHTLIQRLGASGNASDLFIKVTSSNLGWNWRLSWISSGQMQRQYFILNHYHFLSRPFQIIIRYHATTRYYVI
jgi:hypothetical protein